MLKIYLIAGEASGDNIGAKLMKALKLENPKIKFYGIGGDKMQQVGMNLNFHAKELAVMGFFEILPHIWKFIKLIKKTISDIIKIQPDVIITIDSPGFSFRVAKAIKNKIKGKLIHYVAPTVWVYNAKRAEKIAKIYDHLLVILPFEPVYFLAEGLDTTFVGHPAIEDLKIYDRSIFREQYNIKDSDILICLAPGSRKQEIQSLLPIFIDSINLLKRRADKKIVVAIPANNNLRKIIEAYIVKEDNFLLVKEEEKEGLFSSADFALTKSGTITTELSFYKIPMVVAHKVNKLSFWILKSMIKVKFATIINILANKELIPELLQDKCNSINIEEALYEMLQANNLENSKKAIQKELNKLKVQGALPSEVAAKKILELI